MPLSEYPPVRGFLRNSLNEWDGRLACVVFLGGCNYRCPFCHGRRFVEDPEAMPEIAIDEILDYLDENEGWIDGVVVSGGEPTLHPAVGRLVHLFSDRGLEVKLHTNGSTPRALNLLLASGTLDCVALDFKAPLRRDPLRRAAGAKVDAEPVRESFRMVVDSGLEHEFHTTLCPPCLPLEELPEMAAHLAEIGATGPWILQRYNPGDVLDADAAGTKTYEYDEVEAAVEGLRNVHPDIRVRGFVKEPVA